MLVDEAKGDAGNPWGIRFMTMFHMSNDSGLFSSVVDGLKSGATDDVPLYEAKMINHFEHRWATFEGIDSEGVRKGLARDTTLIEQQNPDFTIYPRFWVHQSEVERRLPLNWRRGWLTVFRGISSAILERTFSCAVIPATGVGNSAPLLITETSDVRLAACLVANLNSMVFDYVVRTKVAGNNMNFFYVKQFPVLAPNDYSYEDVDFVALRMLELSYTAWDLRPFANDLGYEGPPFIWDESRRALLRGELDAYFARLYGLNRDEILYILDPQEAMGNDFPSETFRVLKEREVKQFGEYRTKRVILEIYDEMAWANQTGQPYQTRLDPPPADPRVAHPSVKQSA